MNLESEFPYIAIAAGVLGLAFSLLSFLKQRNQRQMLEIAQQQIENIHSTLERSKQNWETNAHRITDQSRRIAWLENRVRQPKLSSDEVLDDTAITETPKLNITERRHRVTTLASRGQKPDRIASALGMLPGEVELIINLNQAACRK